LRDPKILRALQYFEAVARHASVKKAAEEFGVSASAVSHQLRDLSQYLGEEIVLREGRGIVLTDTGRRIHVEMSAVLKNMDAAIDNIIGTKRTQLRVAVCSSFGPFWLAERLPDFLKRHPDIDLELRLFAEDPMQTEVVADLIVTAEPVSIGYDSVTLFDEMLVAVRGPAGAAGDALEKPRMITTDLDATDFARDWRDFIAFSGRSRDEYHSDDWLRCTHYLLALGLARSGMGVALVPDFLAAPDLKSGAVVQADRTVMPSGRTYRLCFKTSRSSEADLRTVVRWMRSQTSGRVIPFQKRASH
jgi:LysR family transcriptional regulator, glycine cleavage system transcriptional activator